MAEICNRDDSIIGVGSNASAKIKYSMTMILFLTIIQQFIYFIQVYITKLLPE